MITYDCQRIKRCAYMSRFLVGPKSSTRSLLEFKGQFSLPKDDCEKLFPFSAYSVALAVLNKRMTG